MSPAEVARRQELAAELTSLADRVAQTRPRVERVDAILTFDLSRAVAALLDVADGVLDLEDGSRLPAAAVRA